MPRERESTEKDNDAASRVSISRPRGTMTALIREFLRETATCSPRRPSLRQLRRRFQSTHAADIAPDVFRNEEYDVFPFALVLHEAARKAGWLPAAKEKKFPRVSHVGFGLVLGSDGKRFRTPSSEVVRLVELLDEAKTQRKAELIQWLENNGRMLLYMRERSRLRYTKSLISSEAIQPEQ